MAQTILAKLEQGDLRTTGKVDEVVEEVINKPHLFNELYQGLFSEHSGIRMRAADALVKVTAQNPELIQPYKQDLIKEVSKITQQEVQWHLAQLYAFLDLTRDEEEKILNILIRFIETTSSNIVKVFSLQTLAEIAEGNNRITPLVVKLIKSEMEKGAPSVVSRGKKLLKQLKAS